MLKRKRINEQGLHRRSCPKIEDCGVESGIQAEVGLAESGGGGLEREGENGRGPKSRWVCEGERGKKLGERIFLRERRTQEPTAAPEQAKTARLASRSVVPGFGRRFPACGFILTLAVGGKKVGCTEEG